MSEQIKKVDQTGQEAKASELSEQDLDNVAGGAASVNNTSKSNVRNPASLTGPITPTPTNPPSPFPKTSV